jgi:hypothetical protein
VLISFSLNTKDDLYTCKGHAKQGNLSVSLIDNTYNKIINYFKEH